MTERDNRLLVIDDDPHMRELLRLVLEREGFRVFLAPDGGSGLRLARETQPDLVVLDLMLPGLSGWEVCRDLRRDLHPGGGPPILMLTARGEEEDVLQGFELGADDYVVKPFSPRQLVARVRALLRRSGHPATPAAEGMRIDPGGRRVWLDGREVSLAPKEFDLLRYLAARAGQVVSRRELLREVWTYQYLGDARTVDEHIKRLRQKLAVVDGRHRYIHTVWGTGYRFEAEPWP